MTRSWQWPATALDRRGLGAQAALEHVRLQGGSQFAPQIVDALVAVLAGTSASRPAVVDISTAKPAPQTRSAVEPARSGPRELSHAINEFDLVPAFAPAHERVLAALASSTISGGELVAEIERTPG